MNDIRKDFSKFIYIRTDLIT